MGTSPLVNLLHGHQVVGAAQGLDHHLLVCRMPVQRLQGMAGGVCFAEVHFGCVCRGGKGMGMVMDIVPRPPLLLCVLLLG